MMFRQNGRDVELYHGPFGVWGTVFYGTKGIVAVNRGEIALWLTNGLVKPDAAIRKQVADATLPGLVAASIGKDYGTDATVKQDNRLAAVLDRFEKDYKDVIAKAGLYVSQNQVRNFCECIETRKNPISDAETGARSGVLCLLCNLSYQYDTGFEWDGEKLEIKGCNRKGISTRREVYRNGWEIIV
jgi:hypothetical protein